MLHSLKKHKKIYVENLNWAKETDREPKYPKKEIKSYERKDMTYTSGYTNRFISYYLLQKTLE